MKDKSKILIVDDDELVLETLYEFFIDDYHVVTASSGMEAVENFQKTDNFEAVILDIKMARMDGLETANRLKKISSDIPIIFYTGYPGDFSEEEIENDHRPFDYVIKNERPARLTRSVKNAVNFGRLQKESSELVKLAREQYGMVGKSAVMQEVYKTIEQIAPQESKVMIIGPTGTGKELVAQAIHSRSRRKGSRMFPYSCSQKNIQLVESELFGHVKGAFTDAIEDRFGIFEYADGGTVFLDEIADLDIGTQAKLLRILDQGQFSRVGSPNLKEVDVRVICATNKNLDELVDQGKFREDLYYRLKGVTINLPLLKERREDIPDLIEYFMAQYSMEKGDGIKVLEPEARDLLIEYEWPGNVRQLLYTIRALMDLVNSHYITRGDVEKHLSFRGISSNGHGNYQNQLTEMKKVIIIKALAESDNNIAAAARLLELDRGNLYRMIKDLGIKTD